MADFCNKCAKLMWGEHAEPDLDIYKIFQTLENNYMMSGLICEGCGLMAVANHDGKPQVHGEYAEEWLSYDEYWTISQDDMNKIEVFVEVSCLDEAYAYREKVDLSRYLNHVTNKNMSLKDYTKPAWSRVSDIDNPKVTEFLSLWWKNFLISEQITDWMYAADDLKLSIIQKEKI